MSVKCRHDSPEALASDQLRALPTPCPARTRAPQNPFGWYPSVVPTLHPPSKPDVSKAQNPCKSSCCADAPGEIRTPDLRFRRPRLKAILSLQISTFCERRYPKDTHLFRFRAIASGGFAGRRAHLEPESRWGSKPKACRSHRGSVRCRGGSNDRSARASAIISMVALASFEC
jgi:hypothetical protein